MNNTVSNDRDRDRTTAHRVTFEIDPQMGPRLVARPTGLLLSLDVNPELVGLAVLAYLRTARRIALDEADEAR